MTISVHVTVCHHKNINRLFHTKFMGKIMHGIGKRMGKPGGMGAAPMGGAGFEKGMPDLGGDDLDDLMVVD